MTKTKDVVVRESGKPEEISRIRSFTPPVDIYENNDELLLLADLPGVDKEAIQIRCEDDVLSVEASMGELASDMAPLAREFDSVRYRRSFKVIQGVDVDRISAEYRDGLLKLHLPKSEAVKPRTITVQSS
jgi:HSP20 family molecular chaperone IbpA